MDEQQSPKAIYAASVASKKFTHDAVQEKAVNLLDKIWHEILNQNQKKRSIFRFFNTYKVPQGLYMWGGVGRGKTWLMDQFFDSLPIENKMRMHFHHFMKYVHNELHQLQGHQNPLNLVAEKIHKQATVICFDEFFVSNVPDAMIMSDLFQKLFNNGITLIATSNIEPDLLYKDGLHRDRFLPMIELLKNHCQILNVDSGIDYRLRVLKQAELFKSPLNQNTKDWLEARFTQLTSMQTVNTNSLEINHRLIENLGHTNDVLWCEFSELCLKPKSPADFIILAEQFNTILISNVPHLSDQFSDAVRRFIYLVDELYDRRVKVLMTSQDPILEIYSGDKLAFEIQRTRSRLLEMQSDEYLHLKHMAL